MWSTCIGGWGGESAGPPTGKSFRFVCACERSEARRSCVGAFVAGCRGSARLSVPFRSVPCPIRAGVVPWLSRLSRLCQNSNNELSLFSRRTRKAHSSSFGTSPCFALRLSCARGCPGVVPVVPWLSRARVGSVLGLSRGCPGVVPGCPVVVPCPGLSRGCPGCPGCPVVVPVNPM